jgi:hypothetical protein
MRCMANGLGAAVGVRLARVLYRRWESLLPAERERLASLADDVKQRALDVRGQVDGGLAERGLEQASGELADALGADEVAELRAELKRELDRVERERRAA